MGSDPHIFVVGAWERPDTRNEWVVPRSDVEATVHKAMGRWKVIELACDPPGWHREIEGVGRSVRADAHAQVFDEQTVLDDLRLLQVLHRGHDRPAPRMTATTGWPGTS